LETAASVVLERIWSRDSLGGSREAMLYK